MNIVLFEPDEITQPLPLRDERAKHIVRVLHKGAGDTFAAGIIDGAAGMCTITAVDKQSVTFTFTPGESAPPLLPVRLIVGFPRPIQLRRLLRDVVSLGVAEIHLTATELGDKSYLSSTLLDRGAARRDMIDGCAQAKGTQLPRLVYHESLSSAVSSASGGCGTKIVMDIDEMVQPLSSLCIDSLPAVIAIGSERGWTDNERHLFKDNGFLVCSLGKRVLRTETACTACVAVAAAAANLL